MFAYIFQIMPFVVQIHVLLRTLTYTPTHVHRHIHTLTHWLAHPHMYTQRHTNTHYTVATFNLLTIPAQAPWRWTLVALPNQPWVLFQTSQHNCRTDTKMQERYVLHVFIVKREQVTINNQAMCNVHCLPYKMHLPYTEYFSWGKTFTEGRSVVL